MELRLRKYALFTGGFRREGGVILGQQDNSSAADTQGFEMGISKRGR